MTIIYIDQLKKIYIYISQSYSNQRRNSIYIPNSPLFPSIPLKCVVIYNLHLFLRVTDVFIDLFIEDFMRQDALEKGKTYEWLSAINM